MLCIGLTGGIGSGKSTIAAMFEVLGIPVLYADTIAKDLMTHDEALKASIIKAFGQNAYLGESLNRSFLANIVFKDPERLKVLNQLVHPATLSYSKNWIDAHQQHTYVIKEAALLFESRSHELCDYVIGVKTNTESRISRTIARSKLSREEVSERMQQQMPEEQKLSMCDYLIQNNKEDAIIDQVLKLHQVLKSLPEKKERSR